MSWFAAYIRCNHEKTVERLLTDKGLNTFLPQIIVPSRRRDRKLLIRRPLFRNYLFIELNEERDNWLKVFRTPGVAKICGNGQPMAVPDDDIRTIRIFVESDRNLYPLAFLQIGSRVQVISGPLTGAIGVLAKEDHKRRRLVVNIELMGQAVAASLHDDEVKPY
jgi:transcriptional antiterminator RfaH